MADSQANTVTPLFLASDRGNRDLVGTLTVEIDRPTAAEVFRGVCRQTAVLRPPNVARPYAPDGPRRLAPQRPMVADRIPPSDRAERVLPPPGMPPAAVGVNCPSVLWVDDTLAESDVTLQYVRKSGFRVAVASTGGQALELARSKAYCTIILDLRLPDMYGLEVLECFRRADVHTPVMIVTGFPDLEAIRRAGALGAVAVRAKPVDVDQLIRVLRHLCDAATESPNCRLNSPALESDPTFDLLLALDPILDARAMGHVPAGVEGDSKALLRALVAGLAPGDLPVHVLLACARVFRYGVDASFDVALVGNARRIIAEAHEEYLRPRSPGASIAITVIEHQSRPHALSEEEVATHLSLTRSVLGKLLCRDTSLSVREVASRRDDAASRCGCYRPASNPCRVWLGM